MSKKGITFTLDKSSYAPLTNIHGNQLSVSVRYQVDDKSLADKKINGLENIFFEWNIETFHLVSRRVYCQKEGSVEELKTTIRDPTLDHAICIVTFTDLKKTETLSNSVTVKLVHNQTGAQTTNSKGE